MFQSQSSLVGFLYVFSLLVESMSLSRQAVSPPQRAWPADPSAVYIMPVISWRREPRERSPKSRSKHAATSLAARICLRRAADLGSLSSRLGRRSTAGPPVVYVERAQELNRELCLELFSAVVALDNRNLKSSF
eukprot:6492431-Amphidinium_carterae.2